MGLDANKLPAVFACKSPVVSTCVGTLDGLEDFGFNVVIAPLVVTEISLATALELTT